MPAVLRAYGADFDVDAFLVAWPLPVCAVKRRGEPVLPTSQPNGRRHEESGVHLSASDADFGDFPRQVEETTEFLRANAEEIRRLCELPGVEGVTWISASPGGTCWCNATTCQPSWSGWPAHSGWRSSCAVRS